MLFKDSFICYIKWVNKRRSIVSGVKEGGLSLLFIYYLTLCYRTRQPSCIKITNYITEESHIGDQYICLMFRLWSSSPRTLIARSLLQT